MGPSFSGKTALAEIWAGMSRVTHRVTPKVTLTEATVKDVHLFILDCGGTRISRRLAEAQVASVDYVAFVFDSTSVDSFAEVREMVKRIGNSRHNMLLIATKVDLEARILGPEESEIEAFAQDNGLKYFKTSLLIPVALEPANWIASDLLRKRSQRVN